MSIHYTTKSRKILRCFEMIFVLFNKFCTPNFSFIPTVNFFTANITIKRVLIAHDGANIGQFIHRSAFRAGYFVSHVSKLLQVKYWLKQQASKTTDQLLKSNKAYLKLQAAQKFLVDQIIF